MITEHVGDKPWSFFQECLDCVKLRSPSYWTFHPKYGQQCWNTEFVRRQATFGYLKNAPAGLVATTHLSKQSQESADLEFPIDSGDLTDEGNAEIGKEATVESASDFIPKNAYLLLHRVFERCSSTVQTREQLEAFRDGLQALENKLCDMAITATSNIDKRYKDKRITKASSPHKRKAERKHKAKDKVTDLKE